MLHPRGSAPLHHGARFGLTKLKGASLGEEELKLFAFLLLRLRLWRLCFLRLVCSWSPRRHGGELVAPLAHDGQATVWTKQLQENMQTARTCRWRRAFDRVWCGGGGGCGGQASAAVVGLAVVVVVVGAVVVVVLVVMVVVVEVVVVVIEVVMVVVVVGVAMVMVMVTVMVMVMVMVVVVWWW